MTEARLTNHARARAAEMGVGTKEVKRTLRDPELEYHSAAYECQIAVAGRLAVPYVQSRRRSDRPGTRIAVTVLWRGAEERPRGDGYCQSPRHQPDVG